MRVATWNLERPKDLSDKRAVLIHQQIEQINADIWILTETNSELRPGEHFEGLASGLIETTHSPGECRTAVWTRFPIISKIPTFDSKTSVCVEVESPKGPLLVYGTIIPYGGAGIKYGYWFNGNRRTDTRSWQLHCESIKIHKHEWKQLREKFPKHLLFISGDFNQNRDGRRWGKSKRQWYGIDKGRQLLSAALSECGVECVTETDFVEAGQLKSKSSVDHICIDSQLAHSTEVSAWEAGAIDSKLLTDHNGVYLDIM